MYISLCAPRTINCFSARSLPRETSSSMDSQIPLELVSASLALGFLVVMLAVPPPRRPLENCPSGRDVLCVVVVIVYIRFSCIAKSTGRHILSERESLSYINNASLNIEREADCPYGMYVTRRVNILHSNSEDRLNSVYLFPPKLPPSAHSSQSLNTRKGDPQLLKRILTKARRARSQTRQAPRMPPSPIPFPSTPQP